jgi:hypothetical protein
MQHKASGQWEALPMGHRPPHGGHRQEICWDYQMRPHLIACILLCYASTIASATDIPIKEGMPFLSARKALLKHGWKPSVSKEMQPVGTAIELQNMGIIEIERCSQGVQYCELHYKKNKQCLGVTTTGEEVADLIIDAWDFRCP